MTINPTDGKLLIGPQWTAGGGADHQRTSPAYESLVWQGQFANKEQATAAIEYAGKAQPAWARKSLEERTHVCREYARLLGESKEEIAELISVEVGKPLWETRTEVAGAIGKVENSIEAILQRRWTTENKLETFTAVTRYRPHGVMFVIGPFNLPLHLPGAHMVPALLAGNTIVFKPSEQAPATGQKLCELWQKAGATDGIVNLVHGGADIAQQIVADERVSGVLFTGSRKVGYAIHKAMAGQPHRVLALELGGNNPLVVHNCRDVQRAAQATIMSSMISSGQRCTCARRLIVVGKESFEELVTRLKELLPKIRVGLPLDEKQPFMGPLINSQSAQNMLAAQEQIIAAGAETQVSCKLDERCSSLLTPGLAILGQGQKLSDEEHFGPLLVAQAAEDLDHAIEIANDTEYGLSAGYIGDNQAEYQHFINGCRAGIVNWNRQTTGASGKLPFGGIGASGNHQPSGYFAADYCSYPVASLEADSLVDLSGSIHGLSSSEE